MRRPSGAREALRLSPLTKARRAHSARVKSVPRIAAGAKPFVLFTGRPTAQWAADTRARGIVTFFFNIAAWNDHGAVRQRTHVCSNRTA
jgi:hypothetical protein